MSISDIAWIEFQDIVDERGRLTAIEADLHVPFSVKRVFYVHQVARGIPRGGHAHLDTDQVLVGLHGSLSVDVSDGSITKTFILDDPAKGLFIPKMLWIKLDRFSPEGICLVLASTHYNIKRSIRTWSEYLHFCQAAKSQTR